jgi:TP901 family phage tail tape measure protein
MPGKFSLEGIFSVTDKLSAPLAKIQGRLDAFGRHANRALRGANKVVDQGLAGIGRFSNAIGIAGLASVAGLGFALTDTMQKGIELENTLIRAGAAFEIPIMKGTAAFGKLNDAAMKIGDTTEHSTLKGAQAMQDLATAGFAYEQSLGALPKIADFATAAQVDLGSATEVASGTLNSFNLKVDDAAKNTANMAMVMDSLVQAGNDSSASVAELYETVTTGGAGASAAGASLQQFLGATNALADTGVKGAAAGTGLSNVFIRLSKQTPVAAAEMKKYGLRVDKLKDGSIDMVGTLGNFEKGMKKLGKSQKLAAINTIFGESAGNAFLKLMAAGPAKVQKYTDSLEGATGKSAELAATVRGSTGNQLQMFFNRLENLKFKVFETLGPLVLQITDAISKWVTENQKLITSKVESWLTWIRDNLPLIATGIKDAGIALAAFVAIALTVKTVSAIATVLGVLSTAFAWLEFTALLLGTTMATVIWPILLIGAAVAGLAALVWKFWPEISGFFTAVYEWSVKAIGDMWAWIKTAFTSVKDFLVASFEFVVGLLAVLFAPQIAMVKWFIGAVGKLFEGAVTWITEALQPLKEFFSGMWRIFMSDVDAFVSKFKEVWAPFGKFFSELWAGIVENFWAFVDPMLAGIKKVINLIRTVGRLTLGTDEEGGTVTDTVAGTPTVSPQARAAQEAVEANQSIEANASVGGTITVEQKPGTKATVKGKRGTIPLRVSPSGAF